MKTLASSISQVCWMPLLAIGLQASASGEVSPTESAEAESRVANEIDSAADATLKDLGFNINRNDDGEVMIINNGHEDNVKSFEDKLGLLSKLRWSKARGEAELPFSGSDWLTPGLNINNVPKTKAGLAHLMELKHLRSLYLERNRNISDDGHDFDCSSAVDQGNW